MSLGGGEILFSETYKPISFVRTRFQSGMNHDPSSYLDYLSEYNDFNTNSKLLYIPRQKYNLLSLIISVQ